MRWKTCWILSCVLCIMSYDVRLHADEQPTKFVAVVLGAAGGLTEDNLTSYLLAAAGSSQFVALDAGTLLAGIKQAEAQHSFFHIPVSEDTSLRREGQILREHVRAYLITHAHLDHISGLVVNAPDDSSKPIMALDMTINALQEHIFNWRIWPNFANEGVPPHLGKYTYIRLQPAQEYAIPGTPMRVTPFLLSHTHGYLSTAFLIQAAGFYVLYCGDTGPDALEGEGRLQALWERVTPLIRANRLRAIFLEASYTDDRPDDQLFGHLTPDWLMQELRRLARMVRPDEPQRALHGLMVIVTHIKPSLRRGPAPRERIAAQLQAHNDLGVRIVVPHQGQRLEF